eukprot:2512489-Rhodomonas_salina.1
MRDCMHGHRQVTNTSPPVPALDRYMYESIALQTIFPELQSRQPVTSSTAQLNEPGAHMSPAPGGQGQFHFQ